MISKFEGCKAVVFFGLFCCLQAGDNELRISLNDGSTTDGRIEIFHNGAWGAVCDDGFKLDEAQTACTQLGYDEAVDYISEMTGGVQTFFVDDLRCRAKQTRLHDCDGSPWMSHDCDSDEKTGVRCQGGERETMSEVIQRAEYYWNCDYFDTGVYYNIRNGHSAVIHGAASLARSPIDSGFRIQGKSSWVNLGNFSDQPCLVDPSVCSIYISAWFRMPANGPNSYMYLLGNTYGAENLGFYVQVKGNQMSGYIVGTKKKCGFWDMRDRAGSWFHLAIGWKPPGKDFFSEVNGGGSGRRRCWDTSVTNQNHVYTIGADEALAGNSNENLDLSVDDLVIMFSIPSSHERRAATGVAKDFDGFAVTELTITLPDIPWDSAYTQDSSSEYTTLMSHVDTLVQEFYDDDDDEAEFNSFEIENLVNNGGDLQMTLAVNFSSKSWRNGFRLYQSFHQGKFLNTTAEVLDCQSKFQSCDEIIVENSFPHSNPEYASVYFYPHLEHITHTLYTGYSIIAYEVNGTRTWVGWVKPITTGRAQGNVKCKPDTTVALTVQLSTYKGNGFRCSNFRITKTIEGSPYAGPSDVKIESVTAFNVTVTWGKITEDNQNGVIQKYKIQLNNEKNHYFTSTHVLVNETQRVFFPVLRPSKRYVIALCGYTSYHHCGQWSYSPWFNAVALLPGKAPRSVSIDPFIRSATLHWSVVHPYYQYGKQLTYPIRVKNMRTGEIDYSFDYAITHQGTTDYSKNLWYLSGLTTYRVNISLVNEVGQGPVTTVEFTTREGKPTAHPENVLLVNVTSDTVSLKWEALDIEDVNGILRGYRVHYRLANFSTDWSNISVTNLTAEIPVLSLRTYEIKVCGYTAVGDGLLSPELFVNTTGFKPSNESSDIKVTNSTNDTLHVEWRYITQHNKPAWYFIVTATRNDTNITEASQRLGVLRWSEDVFWITMEGLKEFKWYNIRIIAGNILGVGPWSSELVLNHTLEGIPSAAPRNLTARNASSRSVLLQWKPVMYEYADGVIRGHKVFWRLASTGNTWQELYVNGTDNTSTEVKSLEKFTDYEFKILAFTSVGSSVTTNTVIARTDEDVPFHPPLDVHTYNTSSRSLRVTWEPLPPQWEDGIIRGYQVIITDTRDGHEYIDDVPVRANRSLERAGFERYTNYTVKVAAYTVKGLGNFSEPILVITDEDVPSHPPPEIQCEYINSTSLDIKWSVLPVVKAHGIVRSYVVFLERNDGRHVELYSDTQPPTSFNTSLGGLDENVEYSVRMLATTIKGEGVKNDPPVTCVTDEDVPHAPPQDLHGFNTSDTSLKVFWQEVPFDDQNGVITGYTVFFNTTLRGSGLSPQHKKRLGTVLERELKSLLPFQYYDIQVAAWTAKGMGPKSNITTILTEEESPKLPPSEVRAFNTSSTSIRLTWRPIPPGKVGGILRGYKIFWEEVNYLGSVILRNETRLEGASNEFLDFHGLTKFQEYRFSILAFTKFDGVVSPNVPTMSDQDIPTLPPMNCSGFNISKNKIHISWDVVPRPDRNGIILGYNIYTDEVFNYFATMPTDYVAPGGKTVVNTTDASARSFIQHNLMPYTDYSFQVNAFTSKGNGPNCTAFVVRTEEEAPLYRPSNLSLHNTSSTSIYVSWVALDPLVIRGVFLGYEVRYTAHPQFPEAYLTYGDQRSKRKRRSVFTLDTQQAKVEEPDESVEITGLAKYTNYTVQVIGYTKFLGAQSVVVQVLTDEDIPSQPPQDLRGSNLSSTSLYVQWKPVKDGFVHGILLGYRIYYRLTIMPLMPPFNMTFPPGQLHVVLEDLFMFTNYSFQIAAFTSKGEGPLSQEVVVCTDEDVASRSPYGFKVGNLYHMHEIPLNWNPVPDGFLNGILTGYRIKIWMISDAMEDVSGSERHIDLSADTLSYTLRKLPNFATYKFQIVALTRYGEGVPSPIRTAKTCPCEKYLTTNWFMLPPYANRTGDQETGIFPWLLKNLVKECCGNCINRHGWSEIQFNKDGYDSDGFKERIPDFTDILNEDTDFHFPVQGHALQEMYLTYHAYVYAVASPGVAFFIVDDPPDAMPNAVLDTVSSSWGLLMFAVIFSFIAGVILWVLDAGENEMEFSRRFFAGAGAGFWWAFISMTTVGYGDKSPRSLLARLFSVFWVLMGLVLTSILMGTITNALTTITFSDQTVQLYGMKVAAIDGSPSYRVGIRRNAKVNQDNKYKDAYELQSDLLQRKVKGALMDGYMAGSYNELFEDEHIRVKEIIDYNSGYGIVLGGIHHRLQRCFKNYVKRKRTYIIDYVASQIETVKKNPKSPAEAQSTNLFNPESIIFGKSMLGTLIMFGSAMVIGFSLHFYFRRQFRRKVADAAGANYKHIPKATGEILETFSTRIASLKKELCDKHRNELRVMSGLKRLPVEYDILTQLKEESDVPDEASSFSDIHDNKFTSKTLLITSPSCLSLNKMDEQQFDASPSCSTLNKMDEQQFNDVAGSSNSAVKGGSEIFTEFNFTNFNDSLNSELVSQSSATAMQSDIQFDLRSEGEMPRVEPRPDIRDLQREAYLAGLKAEGKDSSGHPFAQMYRYLWVEK